MTADELRQIEQNIAERKRLVDGEGDPTIEGLLQQLGLCVADEERLVNEVLVLSYSLDNRKRELDQQYLELVRALKDLAKRKRLHQDAMNEIERLRSILEDAVAIIDQLDQDGWSDDEQQKMNRVLSQ